MTLAPELPDAACAGHPNPDMFYPSFSGRRPADEAFGSSSQDARQICRFCRDRHPCLMWALENDEAYGIWGGTDPHQRARINRRRLPVASSQ